jgi:hypothetical protein
MCSLHQVQLLSTRWLTAMVRQPRMLGRRTAGDEGLSWSGHRKEEATWSP